MLQNNTIYLRMKKNQLEIDKSKSQHVLSLSYSLSSSQVFQYQKCTPQKTVHWAHYVAPFEYLTYLLQSGDEFYISNNCILVMQWTLK